MIFSSRYGENTCKRALPHSKDLFGGHPDEICTPASSPLLATSLCSCYWPECPAPWIRRQQRHLAPKFAWKTRQYWALQATTTLQPGLCPVIDTTMEESILQGMRQGQSEQSGTVVRTLQGSLPRTQITAISIVQFCGLATRLKRLTVLLVWIATPCV